MYTDQKQNYSVLGVLPFRYKRTESEGPDSRTGRHRPDGGVRKGEDGSDADEDRKDVDGSGNEYTRWKSLRTTVQTFISSATFLVRSVSIYF